MGNLEIRQPSPSELDTVQQLRHAVLDPARRIDVDHELTPEDFLPENIHMAAFAYDNIIGTVRLDLIEAEPTSTYEVRKMAVNPIDRNRGIGRLLLEAALAEATSRGATEITLDARKEAIPFFEKLGFKTTGDCIVHNDGVPNYVMKRTNKAAVLTRNAR